MRREQSRRGLILTRILIAGLLLVMAFFFRMPVARHLIQRSLLESTGSVWDFRIDHLDLAKGQMRLSGLTIIPPGASVREAIIADQAFLDVESWGWFDGHAVVRRLRTVGARSASIDRLAALDLGSVWPVDSSGGPGPVREADSGAGREWLDACEFTTSALPQLRTPQMADELIEQWKPLLAAQIESIVQADLALEAVPVAPPVENDNPLRENRRPTGQAAALERVTEQTRSAEEQLRALDSRRSEDLKKLAAASEQDRALLAQSSGGARFSANDQLASRALVEAGYARLGQALVDWAESVRGSAIPDGVGPGPGSSRRVVLPGAVPRRRFTVREFEMDGRSRVGNEHLEFVVFLRNLSDRIELQQQAMTLELRGQGDHHLHAEGEFSGRRKGWIRISCPGAPVGGMVLGDRETLGLTAGEGQLSMEAMVRFSDAGIVGDAELIHQVSGMQITHLHPLLANHLDRVAVAGDFAAVHSFAGSFSLIHQDGKLMTAVRTGPGTIVNSVLRQRMGTVREETVSALLAGLDSALRGTGQEIDAALQICRERMSLVRDKHSRISAAARETGEPGRSREIRLR